MPNKMRKTRTMQKTSEEAQVFLKNAWGEDKLEKVQKNIDARHEAIESKAAADSSADEAKKDESEAEPEPEVPKKRAKLSKHTTMAATAEEGKALLHNTEIDADAKTRNQSKKINELTKATDTATTSRGKRKAAIKKQTTMKKTVKEGEDLLKGTGKRGSTRSSTKKAKEVAVKKPKLTKSRTMKETAKEGKAFLKSLKGKKKK